MSLLVNPSIAVVKLNFLDARFIFPPADPLPFPAGLEDEDEFVSELPSVLSVLVVPFVAVKDGGETA